MSSIYAGEQKKHHSRRGVGSNGSSSCFQSFYTHTPCSWFLVAIRGRAKRVSKQIDAFDSSSSNVRAQAIAGVGGSVKKLLLKVSKQRYLSFSGRFSVVLPGPSDRPVRPAGLPLDGGFIIGSSHGPAWGNGESLVRVCPGPRARWVVVGHARLVRRRLINCTASRRSRRIPSGSYPH